jgi:tetratricopeptide (TPR) repeat protein
MRLYLNLFVVLTLATLSQAQVRVWEGTLTLPTYEEGMPDPNPPFDQFTNNKFNYPYVLRENLTSRRDNHDWRAIYLENEYLKCSVLPDIGGHLYTCIDKISGQSMFYANTSIKKAAVGYRGAWAAFGIEFNFPVSHNWVSMSPVDFAFHKNADGSASVIVGNVDRVYGMEWTVELILRPKSTLLEERVTLSNRSDVRHRFYWWNNAAARVSDDSQIVYPMRFAASHGFTEVVRWPVDEDGHDLSIIRNHVHGPVSRFTHGSREEFMGIWHPATRTGTVHFAHYEELPAKKIWSWGVDEEGLDWRKALSDDNSGYIEIQAGLFRNQETYAFMQPRESIHFSEYWMPVREIGGISRANLSGVLSLARHGNALIAGFNANRAFSKATVSILNGSSNLFSEKVDLIPERPWTHELPVLDSQTKYTVEIRDARGAVLIRQTEGEYDWTPESEIQVGPRPAYRLPDPDQRTCDDWIQLGKDLELNGKNLQALDTYEETLRRFPGSFGALKSAGRLTASLLRFDEAKNFLEQVHARDTSDPEISYYLGVAYDGLGETRKARTSYEDAQRFASYRSTAGLRLGEMLARGGELDEAERHLSEAHRAAPDDVRAIEELVAVKVASGKVEEGKTLARQGIDHFPLSYLLSEELGEPNLKQLANDANRVLNLASQYMRLGVYQRALTVLSRDYPSSPLDQTELGALAPAKHPMIAYFRGYCRERLGQSGSSDYQIASKLSTSYVFPSSAEELTVLSSVTRKDPDDATAHYLLGTLYFSRGLTDSALKEWLLSRKSNPQIPVLDASLGLALLHEKHDAEQALSAFRDGLRSDAANVTAYLGADQALSLLSKPASERVQVLEKYPNLADATSSLIFELILNLAEAGDFQRAESLFRNRFFPREEGGTNVRQVWVEVELQKTLAWARDGHCAEALDLAGRLGAPVPDLPFTHDGLEPILQSARANYLLGVAYASCAKPEEAARKFELASLASAPDQVLWAWRAAQKRPGFNGKEWKERLQTALAQAKSRSDTSSFSSWWDYTAGALAGALGNQQEADQRFQKALLLPDRMLAYHFTRMARAEVAQSVQ